MVSEVEQQQRPRQMTYWRLGACDTENNSRVVVFFYRLSKKVKYLGV